MDIDAPPHDVWTEQACLGALIFGTRDDLAEDAMSTLRPEDFYGIAHQHIYDAICDVAETAGHMEALKVRNRLADKGLLDECGGTASLMDLGESFTISENLPYYAGEVRKLSALRELLSLKAIANKAHETGADVDTLVDSVRHYIDSIRRPVTMVPHVKDAVARALDVLEKRGTGVETGVPTGVSVLDAKLGAMEPGSLTVYGGLPGRGKTALAGQIVAINAVKRGVPCAFFSAEMPAWQLVVRFVAFLSGAPMGAVSSGKWPADVDAAVAASFRDVQEAPLWIDESSGVDIDTLVDRARSLVDSKGVRLVVVDYIQRLTTKVSDQRNIQVAYIFKRLKDLAASSDVAVLALSQLTISADGSANLRWAREVEQDADAVVFIQGGGEKKGQEAEGPEPDRRIVIEKNRHGPTGVVDMTFFKAAMRFGPRLGGATPTQSHYAADM